MDIREIQFAAMNLKEPLDAIDARNYGDAV